jgi:hypothetical protein
MMLTLVVVGEGRAEREGSVGYVWSSRDDGGNAVMELEEGSMGVTERAWWVYQVNTAREM